MVLHADSTRHAPATGLIFLGPGVDYVVWRGIKDHAVKAFTSSRRWDACKGDMLSKAASLLQAAHHLPVKRSKIVCLWTPLPFQRKEDISDQSFDLWANFSHCFKTSQISYPLLPYILYYKKKLLLSFYNQCPIWSFVLSTFLINQFSLSSFSQTGHMRKLSVHGKVQGFQRVPRRHAQLY